MNICTPRFESGRPLCVCIVTPALVDHNQHNDIAMAYHSLAMTLVENGYSVTILYVPYSQSEHIDVSFWYRYYQKHGIRFIVVCRDNSVTYYASFIIQQSYAVYQWLKMEVFDIVHFPESKGPGFFSLLAKQQQLYFKDTIFCVGVNNPHSWYRVGTKTYLESLEDVELDFLERECVALADVVVTPNRYLLNWMKDKDWVIPEHIWIHPNLIRFDNYSIGSNSSDLVKVFSVNELVFFGQLEWCKGIVLFCDALDQLKGSQLYDFKITFLGKTAIVNGQISEDYLRKRATNWPWPVKFITDLDYHDAIKYLSSGLRIGVIPSLFENSPFVVQACLYARVPFLASDTGGIPELILKEDRQRVLFNTRAEKIAEKIQRVLREGIILARPTISLSENISDWLQWHDALNKSISSTMIRNGEISAPLVSVCITHFNRPLYLSYALKSIKSQDYSNFEVILVDDGSTIPEAVDYLDSLEPDFALRGWQLIRQQNRYLGAARNTAARHARGEFLLFMDDDNVAKTNEISEFVKAAQASHADILTCFIDAFRGMGEPGDHQIPGARSLPIGGAAAVGMFKNCFGDANALIRRSVFETLGGFTEDYGVGHEDWEFFARAALKGYRFYVVPEPLFWYRMTDDSMVNITPRYENHMRPLRPYLETVPVVMRDLIHFSYGLFFRAFSYSNKNMEQSVISHGGEIETWQALVDEYWNSTSWRLLRPLRSTILRSQGLPAENKPRITSAREAIQVISMIRDSTSWELMGPMRVVSTALRRIMRRLQAQHKKP